MNYNVKLIMKDGNEILLGVPVLTTHSTNISLGHAIKEHNALLLVLYNKKIQTFIDVTGIPDHLMLIFNRDKAYIGFNVCSAHGDNSYLIGTRAKYALVIPDQDFPHDLHAISHLETEYDVNIEMAIRKEEIDLKLKQLEKDLQLYLLKWKKDGGGTRGHAIGSMLKRLNELKKFFQNYC